MIELGSKGIRLLARLARGHSRPESRRDLSLIDPSKFVLKRCSGMLKKCLQESANAVRYVNLSAVSGQKISYFFIGAETLGVIK